jgi:hypothetical protein
MAVNREEQIQRAIRHYKAFTAPPEMPSLPVQPIAPISPVSPTPPVNPTPEQEDQYERELKEYERELEIYQKETEDYQQQLLNYENLLQEYELQLQNYTNLINTYYNVTWNSFNISLNLSQLSFAFNLSLSLSVTIEINITGIITTKAKYDTAKYGVDKYDPLTLLGVLIPDEITKFLALEMVHKFVPATSRGYKYAILNSFFYLNANMPILTQFAYEPVWPVRFRKMEASKNWMTFFDLSFFDVNAFATELLPCPSESESYFDYMIFDTGIFDGSLRSEMLIRFSELLQAFFDFAQFDVATFDSNIFINDFHNFTERKNNITSNIYEHCYYERATYMGETDPYPELFLLAPFTVPYEPVFDCMNFDYDVFETTVEFNESVLVDIMNSFKAKNEPTRRQMNLFMGADRMVMNYSIHATFQGKKFENMLRLLAPTVTSPTDLARYNSFIMEYVYKRKYYQKVDAELVIEKYVRMGLDETVLRQLAHQTGR